MVGGGGGGRGEGGTGAGKKKGGLGGMAPADRLAVVYNHYAYVRYFLLSWRLQVNNYARCELPVLVPIIAQHHGIARSCRCV